jgi:hypothetical protein
MSWVWRYEDSSGATVAPEDAPGGEFPTQSDAESWLGEHWRELLEAGVEQVSLLEEEAFVYGPMSLRPVEG